MKFIIDIGNEWLKREINRRSRSEKVEATAILTILTVLCSESVKT
jgi:hypothetical protein